MPNENELTHWGVLGMRWGVKRSSETSSSSSSDHTVASRLKKKKLNELSNEELKKLTSRLQLEKQYKDLTKRDFSTGQKFISEILLNVGKQTVTTYLSRTLNTAIETLLKNKSNG